MTLMGCNLDEVKNFINEINKVREKIRKDESYRLSLQNHEKNYDNVRDFFSSFTSYLRYSEQAHCNTFYRVRKSTNGMPYLTLRDLKYPDPDISHEDRMNNTSFRVLYTSLHEFTAMAESRIDRSLIGKSFQLTRFSREDPLKVYRLGLFSELYLNSPRHSEPVRQRIETLLGSGDHDGLIQGYSALEVAMADILYDKGENYHILSSILADALFSAGTGIEAIVYPSMQNRYGINVAFNKTSADSLTTSKSTLNEITEVHENGFFRYVTKMECTDFSDPENLKFTDISAKTYWRL